MNRVGGGDGGAEKEVGEGGSAVEGEGRKAKGRRKNKWPPSPLWLPGLAITIATGRLAFMRAERNGAERKIIGRPLLGAGNEMANARDATRAGSGRLKSQLAIKVGLVGMRARVGRQIWPPVGSIWSGSGRAKESYLQRYDDSCCSDCSER